MFTLHVFYSETEENCIPNTCHKITLNSRYSGLLRGWDGGKWFTVVPEEPAVEAGLTALLPQDQALLQHQNSLSSPIKVLVSVTKVSCGAWRA